MYLLENGTIITNDNRLRVYQNGSILVSDDGKIEAIGDKNDVQSDIPKSIDRIDLKNHLIFPGLVNAHCHMYQTVIRGIGCDRPLERWLEEVKYPFLKTATSEIIYQGTIVSAIENLRSGVTSVINNHDILTDKQTIAKVIKATKLIGLRTIIARGLREVTPSSAKGFTYPEFLIKESGTKEISYTTDLIKSYGNNQNPMLRIWYAPMVTNALSAENLERISDQLKNLNSGAHIHVAETQLSQNRCIDTHGKREIEFLNDQGIVSRNFHCIHGIWLSDHERDLLAKAGSTLVHNPASNGILGSGVMDIPSAIAKGIPIAIGTDGAATNNTNNLLESLKMTIFFQRIHRCDPTILNANQVVAIATHGGAYALGMEKQLGSLEPGRLADIIGISLSSPQTIPSPNPYTALTYAIQGSDVAFVMVNGKIRLHQNKLYDLNEIKILNEAKSDITNFISQFATK